MEIIKDLPEVFEEFAEQRKNSFLAIKKIKDQNIPVIEGVKILVSMESKSF